MMLNLKCHLIAENSIIQLWILFNSIARSPPLRKKCANDICKMARLLLAFESCRAPQCCLFTAATLFDSTQSTVESRFKKFIFPFLNRELFDLRNIYVGKLKTGCSKKKSSLAVNLQIEIFLKSRFDWNKEVDELETESIIWL